MKKAFYILFAFYFLSLSLIPCGDKDECNELSHAGQTAPDQDHEHEDESCTPLCVCACCATHFVITDISGNFAIASVEIQKFHEFPTSKVRGAIITIWQPPKIA